MKKGMNLVKRHFSIVLLSLTTILLLMASVTVLNNTELLSASAGRETLATPSDVDNEDEPKVYSNELIAMATADLEPLAEGDETVEIPFRITHKAGDQDSPVITTVSPLPSKLMESISKNGSFIARNIDSTKDYDGGENKFSPGDRIMFFTLRLGRHYLDEEHFRVYYVSNGVETEISSHNYGSYLAKEFTVPADIPADAELIINAPYINLPDAKKVDIHNNTNLQVQLDSSGPSNHLDYMYSTANDIDGGTRRYVYSDATVYLQAGGKIKISGQSRYNYAKDAFSLKSVKVFSADEGGEFTVEESGAVSYDEAGNIYTLTMPDKEILIDIETEAHLKKTEVVVNSPGNKCSRVTVAASNGFGYNAYGSRGFLFASPEKYSGEANLSANGGTAYTYPAGVQVYPDLSYIYRIVGNAPNSNAATYSISNVKVEKIDENGNVLEDITDSEELGLRYGYDSSYYAFGCYIITKPIDENIRITCTFEQNPAYKLYFKEYPANDGTRLYNYFQWYPLNAEGNPAGRYYNNSRTYSSDMVDLGECVVGSTIIYSLNSDSRCGSQWTTLKSLEVWELDENGEKVQKLDGILPEPTVRHGSSGIIYYNSQKITMPDKNILIEMSYNDGYSPILVEQYVIDDDGTQRLAGSEFSAEFTGTPYDFGDEPYAFTDAEGNRVNTLTAVSTDENHYQFKTRKNTKNISFKLNMPEGYTMAGFKWRAGGYNYGDFFNSSNNYYSINASSYEDGIYKLGAVCDSQCGGANLAIKFVIYYTRSNTMTVVQKTGGAVAPDNKTALGTVTLSRDDSSSKNTDLAPFSEVVGSTIAASQGSTWNTAAFNLLSNNQENTLYIATGTKLKIDVKPDAARIVKSVKAYKIQNGVENELALTAAESTSYTSASYTVDELIQPNTEIRLEVEYAVADKLKVEVLCMDSETGKLVPNTTDASVTITGSGAVTEHAFQELNSTEWMDDFTVTDNKTVTTIGNTNLDIQVDLPADSEYVLANVYAYQMDNNGNASGETSAVYPHKTSVADFSECRDFSHCTFTMPGTSSLIRVYLAKTAQVKVSFQARNDEGEFSSDNIPKTEGTYVTYTNKTTAYGTSSYPVIVENKYNVESYTITNSPATRTVQVLEKSNISGYISIPKGYVIASVFAVETNANGEKTNLSYSFRNPKFEKNGDEYLYQSDFNITGTINVGCTYEVTINIEKATGIIFEAYHSSDDGFVPNAGKSNCVATLTGVRTAENPAYASAVPFAQGRKDSERAGAMVDKLVANGGRSTYNYYVLSDTTLSLTAKPVDGEVVSDVKVYFENDPNTLIEVTETGMDEDGTIHYTIPQNTKLSDTLVVQVYFSADLSGRITVENVTTDGSALDDTCYTYISIGNYSYPNPIYDVQNDRFVSKVTTNAAASEYKVMTNSTGSITVTVGNGYILESSEIRYSDTDEFKDTSSTSANRSKTYIFRTSDFSSSKHITIRNTYRPAAMFNISEYRDLNDIPYYAGQCVVNGENDALTGGPLFVGGKYSDNYICRSSQSSFMVAKGSALSLSIYEEKDSGYTLDYVELYKDGELLEKKTRSDLAPSVDGRLIYNLTEATEQSAGKGYEAKIYYKADYVNITQQCRDTGQDKDDYCYPGKLTLFVNWPEDNPIVKERTNGGSINPDDVEGTRDDNNTSEQQQRYFTAGLLYNAKDYTVRIEPNASHRISEIWYGLSPSTMEKYEDLPELKFGASYDFTGLSEFGISKMRYIRIVYEVKWQDNPTPDLPVVEKGKGLMTVNVYEENEGGYQLTTENTVQLSFNSKPQIYENGAFNDVGDDNVINLPYSGKGTVMFSALEDTLINFTAVAKQGYRLEKVVLTNLSKGSSELMTFFNSSADKFKYTINNYSFNTGNWAINFYFSKPTVEVGTNNTVSEPKGCVELNGTLAIADNEYMKAFKFNSGSSITMKLLPNDGYEFAYILSGSSRTNMKPVDSSKITRNDNGTVDINFGTLVEDIYVQVQFNSIDDTPYSQLNVSHYKADEAGGFVLSTEGKVYVSGIHSNIPEPFRLGNSASDYINLTTEGQITTDVAGGTKLTVSVTPPENHIISDFKAMYYNENGQSNDITFTRSGNTFDLSQNVIVNTAVFIEVYYQSGYRIYYHGSGCSGTVPSDETIYYSGKSATVLGKGEMTKEHCTFLGWSTTGGKDSAEDVEYSEGDSITFSSGDIHLYAVWEEECTYKVVYHADDKDGGSVPFDVRDYYLNHEAGVLGNPTDNPLIKTGYTFTGWNLKKSDNTFISCNVGDTITVTTENLTTADEATEQAVNLYVVWAENSYKLTYDKNTTDTVTDMPVPSSVSWNYSEVGEKLDLRDSIPKRTGYTFKEWNTKVDGKGTGYAANGNINGSVTKTASDITLYAIWTENSYKLTYDKNTTDTVTNIPDPDTWTYSQLAGGQQNISSIKPERKGYTFQGWKIGSRNDTNYVELDDFTDQKATAFAQWKPINYTVTYEVTGNIPDGYTVPTNLNRYIYGDPVDVEAAPKYEGYTFEGWTYNDKIYAKDTANASLTITENVTLVGVWTKNTPNIITVTYQSGVECENANDPLAKKYTFSTAINEDYTVLDNMWYNRPGYTFKNWVVAEPEITGFSFIDHIAALFAGPANLGQKYVGNDIITALSENITLEAQWEPINYTVTYDGNGATGGTVPVDSNSYFYNDIATVKEKGSLVKPGFSFVEWNTSPFGTGTSYSESSKITITDNVRLYAIWRAEPTPGSYKVTYNGNGSTGGATPKDYTDYIGGEIVTVKDKETLEKSGCTFKEWNTQPDGKGTSYNTGDTFIMPESDVILYAIWIDGNDNIILTPKTGESNFGILLAVNICIFSLVAVIIITVRMLKRRRENTAC